MKVYISVLIFFFLVKVCVSGIDLFVIDKVIVELLIWCFNVIYFVDILEIIICCNISIFLFEFLFNFII